MSHFYKLKIISSKSYCPDTQTHTGPIALTGPLKYGNTVRLSDTYKPDDIMNLPRIRSGDHVISRTRSRVVSRDSRGNPRKEHSSGSCLDSRPCYERVCPRDLISARRTSSPGFAGNYRHETPPSPPPPPPNGKHAKSPCRRRLTDGISLSARAFRQLVMYALGGCKTIGGLRRRAVANREGD